MKPFWQKFKYIFYRHFWMQILAGRYLKPLHYILILAKHKIFGYPYLAIIETTNTCNLNCPTCPTPRHKLGRPFQTMNLEDFKKIIDKIRNHVQVILLYNTNEPLIHPDLPEMVKYCDKNNLFTMISTNAMLLDEKKTNELFEAGLDEILLCLDGTSKIPYEEFRRGANFETVAKNINHFCKEKKKRGAVRPYIELQFIQHKLNQDQVPEIEKWAKIWDVNRLRVKSFALCDYAYTKEEIKELSEKFLPTIGKMIFEKQGDNLVLKKTRKECALVKTQCSVLVDGSLVMCCYDIKGEYVFGNILKDDFKKIWNNPEIKIKIKAAKEKKFPLCKVCGEY